MSVRRLIADDFDAMRALRLEALRLHPEAFAADLDAEEAASREEWLQRLASATTFGGFVGDTLSGMAVYSQPARKKIAHTASLGAMYVRESARGSGLGDAIMEAVLAKAAEEAEQIQLTVNAENARAIAFYKRHGFFEIGCLPHALRVNGRYYDELSMLRTFAR